jgi:hypothetical protein
MAGNKTLINAKRIQVLSITEEAVDDFKEKVKIKDVNGGKCGMIKTFLCYIIGVASIILVLVGLTLILLYVIPS